MTITYHAGRRIQGLSTDTVEAPTFESDFSSTTGWTDDSGEIVVNTTLQQLAINFTTTNANDTPYTYYDLTSVSDTEWRFDFDFDTQSLVTPGNYDFSLFVGLSSSTLNMNNAQDFIGLNMNITTASTKVYKVTDTDGIAPYNTGTSLSRAWNVEHVYVSIIRQDATNYSVELFSDEDRTISLERSTQTCASTTQTLRYIRVTARDNSGHPTGSLTARINKMRFWNGVSSLTSKPTNVQLGSRFEETDTRKIYYANRMDTSGCKAYYNFEQTSGNLINQATTANGFADGLGSNGDLTTSGSITKNATGKVGTYSWNFTSTNGYAEETTTNALPSTFSAWTLNVWCKPASVRTSYMFGLTNNDGNTNNFQFITTSAGGKFQGVVGSNSNQVAIVSTSSYSTSVWQMVTVVYDGSLSGTDRLKLYFNGTSEGTATGTPSASYTLNSYPDVGRQGTSGQPYYTGLVDEASIWNRALTLSEISELYNSGTGKNIASFWTEEV